MMHCPRDARTLRRTSVARGANVWACAQCNGRAIAMPVLRRQASEVAARDLWRRAITAKPLAADGVACPACMQGMVNAPLALGEVTVALDVCTLCHLVWFDPGEETELPPVRVPETSEDALVEYHEQLTARERGGQHSSRGFDSWSTRRLMPSPLFRLLEVGAWSPIPLATAATMVAIAAIAIVGWVACPDWLEWLWFTGHLFVGCFWAEWSDLFAGIVSLAVHLGFFAAIGGEIEDRHGPWRWLALIAAAVGASAVVEFMRAPEFVPACGLPAVVTAMVVAWTLQQPTRPASLFAGWWTEPPLVTLGLWVFAVIVCNTGFSLRYTMFEGPGWHVLPAHLCGALVGLLAWLAWRDRPPR
jgi:hypothetical protein